MTAFYANDLPESKAMFWELDSYLEGIELNELELEAGNLLLQSFGSRSIYPAISSILEGKMVEDDRADRGEHPADLVILGYSQHNSWLEERIIAMTFRYKEIRKHFSKYQMDGFLQHYFALHAFYLTRMMGLQIRLSQFLLQVEDYMETPSAIHTLKSMDDLLGNQISCSTSKEAISNLLRIFYGNALIMGLRFIGYFEKNEVEESFQFFLNNLPETEESESKLALAHLDTLPIFRKWYRDEGENPFSQGLLNNVVKAIPTPTLPLVLDLERVVPASDPDGTERKTQPAPKPKPEKKAAAKPGPKPKPKKEEKPHVEEVVVTHSSEPLAVTPPLAPGQEMTVTVEPPAENFLAWMATQG
jgi:hypothetical protein